MATSECEAYQNHLQKYLESRDLAQLKAAFQLLDQDGDGLVSPQDFLAFPVPGQSPEEAQAKVDRIFRIGDLNQDGFLDEKEFATIVQEITSLELVEDDPMSPEDEHFEELLALYDSSNDIKHLEACFQLIDTNGDGVISLEELKRSYLCRGAKDTQMAAKVLMQSGDLNQDGVLSVAEFVALVAEACAQ